MYICGIIKPHALDQVNEIQRALTEAGVRIVQIKRTCFSVPMIDVLYDHMSPNARTSIAQDLVGKTGFALLLEVESVKKLLYIVGTSSDPRACDPESIRARFGVQEEPTLVGNEFWYRNAFHRPINTREAVRDLMHFFFEMER